MLDPLATGPIWSGLPPLLPAATIPVPERMRAGEPLKPNQLRHLWQPRPGDILVKLWTSPSSNHAPKLVMHRHVAGHFSDVGACRSVDALSRDKNTCIGSSARWQVGKLTPCKIRRRHVSGYHSKSESVQ